MKKLFFILLLFISFSSFSQVYVEDSTKSADNTILGVARNGYSYNITFRKDGSLVLYQGRIFNNSGVKAGISLVKVTNPLFLPNYNYPTPVTSATMYTYGSIYSSKAVHLQLSYTDGFGLINESIPANSYIVFSGHYSIQDN